MTVTNNTILDNIALAATNDYQQRVPWPSQENISETVEENKKELEQQETQQEPEKAEEPAADIAEKYETLLANQQATIDKQDKRIDSLLDQITKLVASGAQYNPSNAKPDSIKGSESLERPEYEPIKPEDLRI